MLDRPDSPVSRAHSARLAAHTASGLARERMQSCRRDRRIVAALTAVVGTAGLVGTVALLLFDVGSASNKVVLGILAALAQSAPLVLCTLRAFEGTDAEANIAIAVESARNVSAQAERLRHLITTASEVSGIPPATRFLIDKLLDDLEQAAAAANGRERRIQDETTRGTRRHKRIKPRHDRVIITTADRRKLVASVVDVSQSGAAVEGNIPRVPIGTEVMVGSHKARVVRMLPRGMAFEFVEPIPASLLDENIKL